ncbi:MAG: TonB-dependent receptor [Acidobacteria bacterium]|nr:TonB-dependent receptor [Acidobacteriota bacterium]
MSVSREFTTGLLVAALLAAGVPAGHAAAQTPAAAQAGQTVRVVGVVRDGANAIELPGVPVEVVGADQVVYTDNDGRYVLQLTPGNHQIRVVLGGYEESLIDVVVQAGGMGPVDIALRMQGFSEQITVTAEAIDVDTSSARVQLTQRMNAQSISDNIGAQEMRANGDGDAAAAMQRVTGLSVVDDFLYVRGLGERYSNTTLNDSVIPTTQPDRKVVPLDLFPTGLIDSVQVVKSYVPDRSAEFAGGLVQIETIKVPTGPIVDVSYSIGYNSQTTGNDVLGGTGGSHDWLGYGLGARTLPTSVPNKKVIKGGRFTPDVGLLSSELEQLGQAFSNDWSPVARSAKPNQGVSAVAGTRVGKVGVQGSYTQSYNEQSWSEDQTFYRTSATGLSEFSDYDFEFATREASVGVAGSVAVQANPTNRLVVENFYTHTGKDEARTFTGFNSDIATDIRDARQFWIEEDLLSNTVSGEHFARSLANSSIDWRVSYAKANRDEPDLRETLYERNGAEFVLSDESQSGFRMFNVLDDRTVEAAANWSVFGTQWSDLPVQFKAGGSYVDRTRDFSSRRFRFIPTGRGGVDTTLTPEQLFTASNIGTAFEIREETRVTDAYDAQQSVTAFYAMTDVSLSSLVRLVAGARVEQFDQQVNTFDLFDFEGDPDVITARLKNTDVFPAVNLVFAVRPGQNIRAGFSQTTNRPEFRELAPFEFTDIVGGRAVVGNPDLSRALIQNVDLRWEMFPGGADVVAASFFYKRFVDPIERIVEPTSQLRTSFTNADSARNVGLEFEVRRKVAEMVTIGGNYTFVDSRITLTPAAAQVQTSLERALAGQSRHLANAVLEVGNAAASLRLLYNFFGDRISDVGSLGLPDIIEDQRSSLDLIVSTQIKSLKVRASAENLTNEAFDLTQGGLLQRRYELGRTLQLSFGFSAF